MKPTKCPAKEKKWGKKSERRGKERKLRVEVKTAVSLLKHKNYLEICLLRMPELSIARWYFVSELEGRKVYGL